jgi:diaminohydroxyphosphoribosylaminopyrimidine deaminase/5-amino-6-(5-phosphoribosylamino)uracil reductase
MRQVGSGEPTYLISSERRKQFSQVRLMTSSDEFFMQRALALAERGRGHVEPNPLVGAVVVRDGQVVGEGWHQCYGQAHAEVNALTAAGEAARGATLYVTLEPCCHQGKTPPCTDAVLRSGVRRVVVGMADPFPQVAGKGLQILQNAGLAVITGICESEARQLNAPYLKLLATGRPYVHAKWAMTLDGKIATRTGDSRWISNETSRRRVHELRGRMDAIVVGIGTVLADDPMLTARPPGPRTATRIVLDSHGRTPAASQLVRTARETPTLIATVGNAAAALRTHGCEVASLSAAETGISLPDFLDELGRRRITNLLVEGGARVLGSFLDGRLIDEVHVFIAPKLIGGGEAKSPLGGLGVAKVAEALSLRNCRVEMLDGDVYLNGKVAS